MSHVHKKKRLDAGEGESVHVRVNAVPPSRQNRPRQQASKVHSSTLAAQFQSRSTDGSSSSNGSSRRPHNQNHSGARSTTDQSTSSCSSSTLSSSPASAARELPGFYFDKDKNKYFKITGNRPPPALDSVPALAMASDHPSTDRRPRVHSTWQLAQPAIRNRAQLDSLNIAALLAHRERFDQSHWAKSVSVPSLNTQLTKNIRSAAVSERPSQSRGLDSSHKYADIRFAPNSPLLAVADASTLYYLKIQPQRDAAREPLLDGRPEEHAYFDDSASPIRQHWLDTRAQAALSDERTPDPPLSILKSQWEATSPSPITCVRWSPYPVVDQHDGALASPRSFANASTGRVVTNVDNNEILAWSSFGADVGVGSITHARAIRSRSLSARAEQQQQQQQLFPKDVIATSFFQTRPSTQGSWGFSAYTQLSVDNSIWSIEFDPFQRDALILAQSSGVTLLNLRNGAFTPLLKQVEATYLQPSPSEPSRLFVGLLNGSVLLCDKRRGSKGSHLLGLGAQICCMKALADGHRLLCSSINGKMHLYDCRNTAKPVAEFKEHRNDYLRLQFTVDSRERVLFSSSKDSVLGVWSVDTGRLLNQVRQASAHPLLCLSYSDTPRPLLVGASGTCMEAFTL